MRGILPLKDSLGKRVLSQSVKIAALSVLTSVCILGKDPTEPLKLNEEKEEKYNTLQLAP
jgi:hypothetical protein